MAARTTVQAVARWRNLPIARDASWATKSTAAERRKRIRRSPYLAYRAGISRIETTPLARVENATTNPNSRIGCISVKTLSEKPRVMASTVARKGTRKLPAMNSLSCPAPGWSFIWPADAPSGAAR
jgi:hypothetical protein